MTGIRIARRGPSHRRSSGSVNTPAIVASTNGAVTTAATTLTVTVPSSATGNTVLLITTSNQSQATALTHDGNVTSIQEITQAGSSRRVCAMIITLNGTPSTFTLTGPTSALWQWWCATVSNVNVAAGIPANTNSVGNSTVSSITIPTVTFGYTANGHELGVSAAGVNSTATWTTDGDTVYHTTANNAALMVDALSPTSGDTTQTLPAMDRGSNGTSRNQCALAFVFAGT